MTKAELCKKITDQTGCDMQTVSAIVESLMVSIKGSLEKEENVYLRGFGSFIIKRRAEKTARNISKNTKLSPNKEEKQQRPPANNLKAI